MKFAMSYSFGKDSALALHKMVQDGNEPICLITSVNEEDGRSWFHGIKSDLLQQASDCLNLPVITVPCNAQNYIDEFEKALKTATEMGATACAFGDIDIAQHLDWNKARCASAKIQCCVPLWGMEREKAVSEMLELGYNGIIKIVNKKYLGKEFLGKKLDKALIEKIRATGADICGENGEYHTFVTDGPMYQKPVSITLGDIVDFGDYAVIEIKSL
jgi:uncharacterized protein (TIGR00290 family)